MSIPTTGLSPEQSAVFLNGPAGIPPKGMTPNFEDPPNHDSLVISTVTVCLVLTTLAIMIRIYTKAFLIRSIKYEDYAVVTGWFGYVIYTIPSILIMKYGGGTHIWDVQLKNYSRMLYWVYVGASLNSPIMLFIKLSLLLQYLRIFVPNRKNNMVIYVAIQICIWSSLVFHVVNAAFYVAVCSPREKFWNPFLSRDHCYDYKAIFESSGIFNSISDFAILILPMWPLWRLQMSLKRKISVMAIFATGLFACLTSVIRTCYTFQFLGSPDITYNVIQMGLWTVAEMAIGILVACLPVTPRFCQHIGPKLSSLFPTFKSESPPKARGKPHDGHSMGRMKEPSSNQWLWHKHGDISEEALKDQWHQLPQPSKREMTFDDYDLPSTARAAKLPDTEVTDLEDGCRAIHVIHTVYSKVESDSADVGPRGHDSRQMGW